MRGGGRSVAGLSLVEDGLVIDVRGLSEVVVDPVRRIVRVGGGATWAEVDRATQEHGLAAVGGRVSSTGVAGLTLGGGSGWLERKHGLACDNLVAVELITASGEPIRASADEHPELFWARGGGGNFGVVTALELRLHEVGPEILGGLVACAFASARDAAALPRLHGRRAGGDLAGLRVPDRARRDGIPDELPRGPAIAGMHAGALADAEAALAPIREARRSTPSSRRPTPTSSPRSTTRRATATGGPPSSSTTSTTRRSTRWWRSPRSARPGAQIFIPAWGGAVARGAEGR